MKAGSAHEYVLDTVLPWIPSAHWKWKYLACRWIWKTFVCLFCWIFVFNFFALGKKWFSVWRSVIQGAFYVFKNPPMIKADKQGPGLLLELFYQLFEKCSGKFFSYNLFIAIPQKPTVTSTITACTVCRELVKTLEHSQLISRIYFRRSYLLFSVHVCFIVCIVQYFSLQMIQNTLTVWHFWAFCFFCFLA